MTTAPIRLVSSGLLGAAFMLASCDVDDPTNASALSTPAETSQDMSPVRAFDYYLDAFHVMRDDPSLTLEAHHYCKDLNEDFTQCALFDGGSKDAHLVGIEYIVSEQLFESLPAEEKASWHPHNYEILSGQLVLPGVPSEAEKAALAKKMNSYGKTWHVWDTGHWGHPGGDELPVGAPKIAWSFNRDGEAPSGLVEERDRRLDIDTEAKRKERADLSKLAKPQMGVDLLRDQLRGRGTLPGVREK